MKDAARLDFIVNGIGGPMAFGSTAEMLLQRGFHPGTLRPYLDDNNRAWITNQKGVAVPVMNATLRHEEWIEIDDAIVDEAQIRLNGISDLQMAGLVKPIANGMGKTIFESEKVGDISAADVSMDGLTDPSQDRAEYGMDYVPLPIVSKDVAFSARVLAASRERGESLDTTNWRLATRKVAEKLEAILFNGLSSYKFENGTIYGYTDFPSRNTVTITDWTSSSINGTQIKADVLSMIQASVNDRFYGPWTLYVPTDVQTKLEEDFKANGDSSIRNRLLEIDKLTAIKVSDTLTTGNAVLVQMTPDVIRLIQGMDVTPVSWDTNAGMKLWYKVMAIIIPQIRATYGGRCGICHGSTA